MEDLLIAADQARRQRIVDEITSIQLKLVAKALEKPLRFDSWGHQPFVMGPPPTPIEPTAR